LTTYKTTSNAKKGGLFVGKSHKEGGIPAIVTDTGQPIEVEGGEAIINKEATAKFWKELSEINQSAGNGVPIPPPSDFDNTIEKMEQGGVVTVNEKKAIYDKWKNLVNMSASELERYANSKDGKESGLSIEEANKLGISSGQESAQWIIKMKRTNWKKWTPEMWKWANKQISFISRMRGVKGDLVNEKKRRTPKFKALLIWGHNPRKYKDEYLFATGGTTPVSKYQENLEEILKDEGYSILYYTDNSTDQVSPEIATEISVYRLEPYYEQKLIKLPKKQQVTVDWIMDKLSSDSIYKSFTDKFEKLLNEKGIKGVNAYPTTYGIGIFILFGNTNETKERIDSLLKQYGIEFKNEYSDARYVYRYVISKSKENIERMEKMELINPIEAPIEITDERLKELYAKYDFDKFESGGTISKLIAPNGQPSGLYFTEIYNLVRTPEFKEWFGDWEEAYKTKDYDGVSKIIDENGEPLICVHNSPNEFTEFDEYRIGSTTDGGFYGKGFYFTPNVGQTNYGEFEYNCFLNIKNPFIKQSSHKNYELNSDNLKAENYDGVIVIPSWLSDINIENGVDKAEEIVAYYPEQIKLGDGSNTTFDKYDSDIRFEQGGTTDAKDKVTMDIPLLTRTLELAREDIKSDEDLHHVIENLIDLKDKPVLTMDDYREIVNIPSNTEKFESGGQIDAKLRELLSDQEIAILMSEMEKSATQFLQEKIKQKEEYAKLIDEWQADDNTLSEEYKNSSDYKLRNEIIDTRSKISKLIKIKTEQIRNIDNELKALSNGGKSVNFSDKTGIEYQNVPDFRNINSQSIVFNPDTILVDEIPSYIPFIDEKKFENRGGVLDAIRIENDTYVVAYSDFRYKSVDGQSQIFLLTLDQLVLTSMYYLTKLKATYKVEADRKTNESKERYFNLPIERRLAHYNQRGFYRSISATLKKRYSEEEWNNLDLSVKEELVPAYKKYNPERFKSDLNSTQMYSSFHNMFNAFVNPEALRYSVDRNNKKELIPIGDKAKSYSKSFASSEAFAYWEIFREMMKYKILDIEYQRAELSETYKTALETSFGESNTDNSLLSDYGVLVKRQNGNKISPSEISDIASGLSMVYKIFGNLKDQFIKNNIKISHAGKKLIFSQKAVGVYISTMGTIGVSGKYNEIQFNSTLAHEIAHFIDNKIGANNENRYISDDYESLAGKIAFTFRDNMNKPKSQQSDYINATKECFARALQQYFILEQYGSDVEVIYGYGNFDVSEKIVNQEIFVSKAKFDEKIKPLIEQFFAQNRGFFLLEDVKEFAIKQVSDEVKQAPETSISESELNKKNMFIHKYNPDITFEYTGDTNNGVKGIQRNPKSLSKKERTTGINVNYSDSEFKELFSKIESNIAPAETPISESKLNKNDSLRHFIESQVSSGMLSSGTDFSIYTDIDGLRSKILELIREKEGENEYSIPYSVETYNDYKNRAYEFLINQPKQEPEIDEESINTINMENESPETIKDIKNTTSTPSVSRWDQVPVRWRNISAVKPITFSVNPYDANFLKIVDKYLGDDMLRPVMTAIHFDEYGATVTDAHKLLHIAQKNSEFKGNYPTPVSFKIDKFTKKEDLEKQISETKYPNYLAVVPQETNYTFEVDPFKLLQYCKVAMEYSNKSTKAVSLKFGENKAIGFNANFLIEILESMMRMQKTDKIYAHITSETYSVIFTFTKEYSKTDSTYALVMPYILNDTTFQSKKQTEISMYYGARDLDRNIELSCYYDFTDNEIHNADGSVAVYRQNYGDTADLPASIITTFSKFIKKNNRIAILDNFCVDSIGVRVDNLDSSIIYKNEYGLPNGIYYIQNGATVLYPNFDVDEYPRRMGLTPDTKLFTISTNAFKFYLEKCFISLGEDDLRPVTSSTHIKYDLMEMKMVSTDSHMLSHFTLTDFLTEKPEKSFKLNLAQSKEFLLFLSNVTSDTLTLYADNENYEIIAGESKFLSKLVKGNYPNFEAIITNHSDKELSFNFKDIYTCMNNEIIKSFAKNIDVNIKNLTISNHGNKIISSNGKYDNQTKEYNILNEKEICETEILVKEDFNDPRTFKNFVLIMPVMGTNGVNFNFAYGILNRAISIIGKDYVNMFYTELNKAYYVTSDNLNFKTSDVYKPVKQLKSKPKVIDNDAPQFVEGELVEVVQGNDKMIKSLVGKKFLIHKAYWNMKQYPNQWVYALKTGTSNMPIAETNEIKKTTGEPDVLTSKTPEVVFHKYKVGDEVTVNLGGRIWNNILIEKLLGKSEYYVDIMGYKNITQNLILGLTKDIKQLEYPTPTPEPTPSPAKVDDTDDYKTALIGAKALLKYAESKEEKADIQSYIKGLEVMLK
jgi:DNA polymerase III sliding clamp (beta) subunit (PCNA family)